MKNRLARSFYLIGLVQLAALLAPAILFSGPPPDQRPFDRLAGALSVVLEDVGEEPVALERTLASLRERQGVEASIYDADGSLLVTNVEPPIPRGASDRRRPGPNVSTAALALGGHTRTLVVHSATESKRGLVPPPLLNFLCGFVVIALGSALTARWIEKPLKRLADGARELAGGNLGARVAIDRRDELGVVGAAFDEMAARVQALVQAERELLANVSHELRTPLARVRVALALAAEGDPEMSRAALGEIGADVTELSGLLDRIFSATRAALGEGAHVGPSMMTLERERIAPGAVATRAVERFEGHHPVRPVALHVAPDARTIEVDVVLLGRALGNLLENADKHSYDAKSSIEVRVYPRESETVFEVSDQGVGIAAGDMPRLFEPFFRGAHSRAASMPGVGLGLALVKRVVEAHGGRVEAASVEGNGATFRLYLPRAP